MIANQTSRGLHRVACQSAARWIGLLGSSIALLAACGGTIEQTDVDQQHLEDGNNGKALTKPAEAAATPAKTPAASNQTAAAPAAATPKPAAAEPPPAADEDPPAADEDPPASTTAELKFEADIWPIFSKSCSPCHAGGGAGGQDIGAADKTKALADAKSFEDAIIADINTGKMPLGCAKPPGGGGNCVSAEDFADIKAWYEAGAPK